MGIIAEAERKLKGGSTLCPTGELKAMYYTHTLSLILWVLHHHCAATCLRMYVR